jgi:hypothetical protein
MHPKRPIPVSWPDEEQIRQDKIIKVSTRINRLPGFDPATSRSEQAAFGALGLVGAALIVFAMSDALRFAEERDYIVAALSRPATVTPTAVAVTNLASTNLHSHPPRAAGGWGPSGTGAAAPQR